jgi:predicted Zn-dependent peptidase
MSLCSTPSESPILSSRFEVDEEDEKMTSAERERAQQREILSLMQQLEDSENMVITLKKDAAMARAELKSITAQLDAVQRMIS